MFITIFLKINTSCISETCDEIFTIAPKLFVLIVLFVIAKNAIKGDIKAIISCVAGCIIAIYIAVNPESLLYLGEQISNTSIDVLKDFAGKE